METNPPEVPQPCILTGGPALSTHPNLSACYRFDDAMVKPTEPSPATTPASLVRTQAEALLALAARLESTMAAPFAEAVELVLRCGETRGRVVVTGMGKSGIIAQKIAATLSSTGTPALFLHPAEAVHGDLGML